MPAASPNSSWSRSRQDGLDGRVDGADEHRSRRVAHCRIARQHVRLKISPRSTADVAQLLLLQHLVLRSRDLDRLEMKPATTSLAPLFLRPLTCKQPKPHSEPQRGANEQQIRTAAGLNGVLRAAGVGQGWEGVVQEQAEGWEVWQVRWRWGA